MKILIIFRAILLVVEALLKLGIVKDDQVGETIKGTVDEIVKNA